MRKRAALALCIPFAAVLLINACGGSSGDDDDDDNNDDSSGGVSGGAGEGGSAGSGMGGSGGTQGDMGGSGGTQGDMGGSGGTDAGGSGGADAGGSGGTDAGGSGGTKAPDGPVCPAQGACKFLSLGDGLAAGLEGTGSTGYRRQARTSSGDAARVEWVGTKGEGDFKHEGTPDDKIADLDGKLDAILDAQMPNVVILHIGSEDLAEDDASPTEIFTGIKNIVDKIRAKLPNVYVFVGGMGKDRNQSADMNSPFNEKSIAVDNELNAKRSQFGTRSFFVPFSFPVMFDATGLVDRGQVSRESYYPNSQGYTTFGRTLGTRFKQKIFVE